MKVILVECNFNISFSIQFLKEKRKAVLDKYFHYCELVLTNDDRSYKKLYIYIYGYWHIL